MERSGTHETTGFLHARIDGEPWTATSVVLYLNARYLTVAGPKGGAMVTSLYLEFPSTIKPGQYKVSTNSAEAWFNPGANAASWSAREGVVDVISVSREEPSITVYFDYVAVNPLNINESKKITGSGQFIGASEKTNENKKIQQ